MSAPDRFDEAERRMFDEWGWSLPQAGALAAAMRKRDADARAEGFNDGVKAAVGEYDVDRDAEAMLVRIRALTKDVTR